MKSVEIEFKSIPEYYQLEKRGFKPNTVREVVMEDSRFQELAKRKLNHDFGKITIINRNSVQHHFTRRITDITFFNNLVIISWEHIEVL